MSATAPIRVPRVYEKTGSLLVGTGLSGTASVVPSAVMEVAVLTYVSEIHMEPPYHLPVKPGDLPAVGLEWAVAALLVAAAFTRGKTFRL